MFAFWNKEQTNERKSEIRFYLASYNNVVYKAVFAS